MGWEDNGYHLLQPSIYAYDCNYYIRAWDVYGEDPNQIVDVTRLSVDELVLRVDDVNAYGDILGGAYILGFDDGERTRLVVVIRKGVLVLDRSLLLDECYKTTYFQVWGYDLGTGKWSRLKDLGTKILFVGHSLSFWVEQDTT